MRKRKIRKLSQIPDTKSRQKREKEKEKQEEKRRQKKLSVQQSIAYKEMGRDGICRVQGKTYSKCIRFYDITISWLRMKIKMQSLKTGVTSSITLTAASIFS